MRPREARETHRTGSQSQKPTRPTGARFKFKIHSSKSKPAVAELSSERWFVGVCRPRRRKCAAPRRGEWHVRPRALGVRTERHGWFRIPAVAVGLCAPGRGAGPYRTELVRRPHGFVKRVTCLRDREPG